MTPGPIRLALAAVATVYLPYAALFVFLGVTP